MSEILVLTQTDMTGSKKREHNSGSDSLRMSSFSTANYSLTDTNLGLLVSSGDASSIHNHNSTYFEQTDFIAASTGVTDADKPMITDDRGLIDPSFVLISDYAHDSMDGVADSTAHNAFPLLTGTRDFTGIVSYDAAKSFTLDAQIVDKKYVDDSIDVAVSSMMNNISWKNHVDFVTSVSISDGVTTAQDLQDDSEVEGTYAFVEGQYILSTNDNNIYVIGAGVDKVNRLLNLVTGGTSELHGDREESVSAGDARACMADLIDSPAGRELGAIYVYNGVDFIKYSAVNWQLATGIDLSSSYAAASGTVAAGISIESAISFLDKDVQDIQGVGIASTNSTISTSGSIGSDNLDIDINFSTAFNDALAVKAEDLNSTANGEGASIIGIEDADGYYAASNVEAALKEVFEKAKEGSGVEYTANEELVVGDLVYISAANTVSKLDDLTDDFEVVGVIVEGGDIAATVKVANTDSEIKAVLTGATAGAAVFWTGSGFSATKPTGAGVNQYFLGVAKNATDFSLNVKHLTKLP